MFEMRITDRASNGCLGSEWMDIFTRSDYSYMVKKNNDLISFQPDLILI